MHMYFPSLRLLSAVENILMLEKTPASFSQFEHYADSSANGDQTLKHVPGKYLCSHLVQGLNID